MARAAACLEAVTVMCEDARVYPKSELLTRLRLGELLARSSLTLERARKHLERAVRPRPPFV